MFLNKTKDFEKERTEYELLLSDYETSIEELKNNLQRSDNENKLLQLLLINERKLKKLST